MRIPILAYQPTRIDGNDYRSNDIQALAADLRQVTARGFRIVPLRTIVDAWLDNRGGELDGKIVAFTVHNGADFVYLDLPHPTAGPQRGVFGVLRDFADEFGRKQKTPNLTSFVIASPEARRILDIECMIGKEWWTDGWWADAVRSGLLHIASHSWDYNHDKLPVSLLRSMRSGTFLTIDAKEIADHEIRTAADFLQKHAPNPGTGLFAYPYGESNSYLSQDYFPTFADELGIRAAFTARPGFLEPGTGRWEVPRFVFGRDWTSAHELDAILDAAVHRRPWVPVRTMPPLREEPTQEPAEPPGTLKEYANFFAARVEPIPGWLYLEAGLLTAHFAGAQRALHIRGHTLEIGVYRGKYLSLLYKLAQPDEVVVGVDLFVGAADTAEPVQWVRSNIAKACGDDSRLKLIVADSLELTAERLAAQAGVKSFRFISIDGGHTAEIVARDMETCVPLLAEGGIIALDDVFNFGVPGVGEGVARFFLDSKPALAPFAIGFNKVFVTTPAFHSRYLAAASSFVDEISWLPTQRTTRENQRANRENGFTPKLFGHEVLPFMY